MRLTLSTLPQLAVLAKILCLLMVVMCGAVPSTVRSVSLYSTCSRGNVTVEGRAVRSTVRNDDNAPYQKITTQSEDFSMKLYIFAEKSKRYICFNKRWKIIGLPKKKRDEPAMKERCQFYEIYNGRYLRYRSVVDPKRYIGFNKSGKPMTSQRGREECYNFLKLNPYAVVEHHNSIVSSNKGGMKPQQQQHQQQHRLRPLSSSSSTELRNSQRKLYSSGLRASKNLLVSESPSLAKLAPHQPQQQQQQQQLRHRHRHANGQWNPMSTRRRHHGGSSSSSSSSSSSLLVEASKY